MPVIKRFKMNILILQSANIKQFLKSTHHGIGSISVQGGGEPHVLYVQGHDFQIFHSYTMAHFPGIIINFPRDEPPVTDKSNTFTTFACFGKLTYFITINSQGL